METATVFVIVLGFYFCVSASTTVNSVARHSCQRKCVLGQYMTCRYTLAIRNAVMSSAACRFCPHNKDDCKRRDCIPGNGVKRTITVIDSQYPGPIIDVCYGDTIVAEVQNRMLTESTLMHWHGMFQRDTQYMDGMDFVSQLPTVQANEFKYTFKADPHGTHLYHSHIAFQRMDGVVGPLIVRAPDELNPHKRLYDYDMNSHVLVVQEWHNVRGLDKFQLYKNGVGDHNADVILINGLGRFEFFNKFTNRTDQMEPARFHVRKGYRYRMRLINAGALACPIEMSIDNHLMTLISSDGIDFKPVRVQSITSYAGETYDFVLNADQEDGVYWIKFRGDVQCVRDDERIKQVAVLDYGKGSYPNKEPEYETILNGYKHYNPVRTDLFHKSQLVLPTDLVHDVDYEGELKLNADFVYFMRISMTQFNDTFVETPQLDYITSTVGEAVLLPQRDQLNYSNFCNYTSTSNNCKLSICICEHLIHMPLNSVVELILVDEAEDFSPHTFHLHGYSVRVVASERFHRKISMEEIKEMYYNGSIKKNLKWPVMKDTFLLPGNGYTIVRFRASNPGFWFFHCHFDLHMEMGMHCVFKIGESSDLPAVPNNFPINARFLPDF